MTPKCHHVPYSSSDMSMSCARNCYHSFVSTEDGSLCETPDTYLKRFRDPDLKTVVFMTESDGHVCICDDEFLAQTSR